MNLGHASFVSRVAPHARLTWTIGGQLDNPWTRSRQVYLLEPKTGPFLMQRIDLLRFGTKTGSSTN